MKKVSQMIISLTLLVALAFSLCAVAYADTAKEEFNYLPGDKAPSDIVLTDGIDTVKLTEALGKTSLTDSYAKTAAEHTALVLYENGQDYQPVIDEQNVYTFTVQAPIAIAYMKSEKLYIGSKTDFVVIGFGYEEEEELTWGLLTGDDAEKITNIVASGTFFIHNNLGNFTLTATQSSKLNAINYILEIIRVKDGTFEVISTLKVNPVTVGDSASDSAPAPSTSPVPSTKPDTTPDHDVPATLGPDYKISSSDGNGNSAGIIINRGPFDEDTVTIGGSIGGYSGSITIDNWTGDVSISTDSVQPENGSNFEFIHPGFTY